MNDEPDSRPTINQVVAKLKPFVAKTNMIAEMGELKFNTNNTNSAYILSSINKDSLLLQNFG